MMSSDSDGDVGRYVSVLSPVYNSGPWLEGCIASVERQATVREHLIQDGMSTDCTEAVLSQGHPLVSAERVHDAGQSDALNRALARSSGSWTSWLNADERYVPGGLDRLLGEAVSQNADVTYGDLIRVDVEGRVLRFVCGYPFRGEVLRNRGVIVPSASSLIRRTRLSDDVRWDPKLRTVMDWDLYLNLLRSGAIFHYVRWPIATFAVHPGQVTHGLSDRTSREHTQVRDRYGIPSQGSRVRLRLLAGDVEHRALKALSGAVRLERLTARFAGQLLVESDGTFVNNTWAEIQSMYEDFTRGRRKRLS